jgi:hypothetical protein
MQGGNPRQSPRGPILALIIFMLLPAGIASFWSLREAGLWLVSGLINFVIIEQVPMFSVEWNPLVGNPPRQKIVLTYVTSLLFIIVIRVVLGFAARLSNL